MNLCVVCPGFAADNLLMQPWLQVHELAGRLARRGIGVTIITDVPQSQLLPRETTNHLVEVHTVDNIYHLALLDRLASKAILGASPDAIFLIGSPISSIYIEKLAALGIPIVWNVDNGLYDFNIFRGFSLRDFTCPHHHFLWYPALMAAFPRSLFKRAAAGPTIKAITVPTNHMRERLITDGMEPNKIAVLPSAVEIDLDKSHDYVLDFVDLEAHRLILYFGSPCTLRGTDTLIRSMAQVIRKHDDARALLLSRRRNDEDDREERYLQRLAQRLGLDPYVKLHAEVLPREAIASIIQMSDIVALPFKILFNEFPLSVYEAMKLGKPVITTRCGSLVEISRKRAALAVEAGDHKSLAECISYLIQHPDEAERLSYNAKRLASSLPTWDEIVDKFLRIIE